MSIKLQQPILTGVIGLALTVWLLDLLNHWLWQPFRTEVFGIVGVSVVAGGISLWLRQKPEPLLEVQPVASVAAVERAIAETEQLIEQLEAEGSTQSELRAKLAQVAAEANRQDIRLALIGGSSVGKTSLVRVLESSWLTQVGSHCSLHEMPSLFSGTDTGLTQEYAAQAALAADLVLFLIQGDLTQPEYHTLKDLVDRHKRTVLILNKQDQYLPTQQSVVLKQLQEQSREILNPADIVTIAAAPSLMKVRQHQADGSIQERLEYPSPQVEPLTEWLTQVLAQESKQLVLQSTLDQAMVLKTAVRSQLHDLRRDRALPIIEQYQWIAAAAAFANPLPTLELLAAAAITGKMVSDLGGIYQQKFSLAQAQAVARTLAKLMVKLGLVEFSTQTLGSLLKSNSMTFVAGGVVQGVSAAYLTRLAGLSLIEHFQTLSEQPSSANTSYLEGLGQTLQAVFKANQRLPFLKSLVTQATSRLRSPGSIPALPHLETLKLGENKSIDCVSASS